MRTAASRVAFLSLWVSVASLFSGCASPDQTADSKRSFRVMTYNIHHGEGLDGKVDLPRIARIMESEKADIVALQEVDKGTARTDRRDLPAELAKLTGLNCVFSNNFSFQGGEYGNAVLTRFPVLQATNSHYRMTRQGEQRGILQLILDVGGRELVFMNTHLDFRGDDTERLASINEIEGLIGQHKGKPIILCGDFNDVPGSRTYDKLSRSFSDAWGLAGQGNGFTIPANKPNKRIDYIWFSREELVEPLRARVPAFNASDHLPVIAEFKFRSSR